jgi:LPXTG-site transpeptidase (sortase) family protein
VTAVATPAATAPVLPPVPPPRRARPPRPGYQILGTAITLLGVLLIGFVADLAVVGSLRHARDQRTAYARLRSDLANATAPVGQLGNGGALLKLGTPVALMDIPQLGVREVVLEGTTSGVLRSGPGHRRDSPLPGQPGTAQIFGRRAAFGGPFNDLPRLAVGDMFTVTTGQGAFVYRVADLRLAGDPEPPALAAGAGRLTLVTAAGRRYLPAGTLRVDADLVTTPQPPGTRRFGADRLPAAENAMGTEPAAWVAVVLWGEALLLAALALTWARSRWGRWQSWVAAVPVLGFLGVAVAGEVARLLPNLL